MPSTVFSRLESTRVAHSPLMQSFGSQQLWFTPVSEPPNRIIHPTRCKVGCHMQSSLPAGDDGRRRIGKIERVTRDGGQDVAHRYKTKKHCEEISPS